MIRITSRDNAAVKAVHELATNKKARKQQNAFVCQGFKLLNEAVSANLQMLQIFCHESAADRLPSGLGGEIYLTNTSVLEKISDVKTPQDVVFTCQIPPEREMKGSRFLALEDVRDPGNMGTIIRTAEALAVSGIFLLGDCAELWSPKVVRSAAGSLFRLPVVQTEIQKLKQDLKTIPLYATGLTADAMPIQSIQGKDCCVIIGNEAHGVSKQTFDLSDGVITIPISGAESLNAAIAAAITMWELVR